MFILVVCHDNVLCKQWIHFSMFSGGMQVSRTWRWSTTRSLFLISKGLLPPPGKTRYFWLYLSWPILLPLRVIGRVFRVGLAEPKREVTLELYVQTVIFCRNFSFNKEQTSALLSIIKSIHEANIGNKVRLLSLLRSSRDGSMSCRPYGVLIHFQIKSIK